MMKEHNHQHRGWFESNPRKTLAAVITVAVLLGLAGLLFFYSHARVAVLKEEGIFNAAFTYRTDSDEYHHDFVRNQSIDTATWGGAHYKLRTNSLGFKDAKVREVPLVSDNYRLLFIGDSFTEGLGVPFEETFAGLIGNALKPYNVEVLNAAVVSYSPIIYWRKTKYLLEEKGLKVDEVIVWLDISDAQDEARSYFLGRDGNVRHRIWDDSKIRREIINRIRKTGEVNSWEGFLLVLSDFWPRNARGDEGDWTVDPAAFEAYGQAGLEQMTVYMDRLKALLDRHHVRLTVAVYPWPLQIAAGDRDSIQAAYWRQWCDRNEARFINYFEGLCTGQNNAARQRIIDRYFIKGDAHLNPAGHQLFARVFLKNRTFISGNSQNVGSVTQGDLSVEVGRRNNGAVFDIN